MNLWVGVLFLIVSSQLGINARPIPRPINEAIDGFQSNSWEEELRKRNDISPHDNTKALSGKRDISSREGIDGYETQRLRELQKFTRGELVAEGSYVDEHKTGEDFQTSGEDSRSQETEDYDSLEDRPTGEEFEEEQDVDGESVLETQPKEQDDIDYNHSETEHGEEESESIDHYHGSAREKRSMPVEYEDKHGDFPFHNVPHYFQPMYIDSPHVEDTAPKHLYSQQQHLGTDNKKAYGYMDDKAGLEKPNSMETQPSEQEDYHAKHMEIKQHKAVKSMGHDHYGSGGEARGMLGNEHSGLYFRPRGDIALEHFVPSHEEDRVKNIENWGANGDEDDSRFHGNKRASRESHENTEERNGHETGASYEGNENPDGSNHHTVRNRGGEDGDSESFGGAHDNVIGLVTRYRTHKEPEYGENGIPDGLKAIKRGECRIMSPDDLVESGSDIEGYKSSVDNVDERRAFGGNLEGTKAPERDEDDGDTENNENSEDNEDNEDVEDGEDDEVEFQDSGGIIEETEPSDWYEDHEEKRNDEDNDDTEDGEDVEVEFQDNAGNLEDNEDSDWDEDDEENKENENSEDYEDVEDEDDEDEFLDSGGSFEGTEASGWDKNDEDNEDDKYKEVAEDDEDNENRVDYEGNEDNVDAEDDEDDEYKEVAEDNEDNGDVEDNDDNEDNEEVGDDKDEYEFEKSGGNFEETEASGWDENDEDNENREEYEDFKGNAEDNEDVEDDEDGEDEFQDFEDNFDETQPSDWDEDDEDNEDYKGNGDNESIQDYGDDEDDKDDDKEIEKHLSGSDIEITEASDYRDKYQAIRDDLEENAATEWKEGDKGDVKVSEGEAKTNEDTAYDASVSENKNYELVNDVAHAREASQYGYKYSKGVGGSHITEDYKQ